MARAVDISLIGDNKLKRKFRKLPFQAQKKVFNQAARKAWEPVLDTARALVPVRTGKLKKSLKLRRLKRSRVKQGVEVKTGTREELGIDPGSPWYYPAHVELGTSGQSAQSYLRTSFKTNTGKALRILATEIGNGVIREARKA